MVLDDYSMPWSFSAMEDAAFATFVGAVFEEKTASEIECVQEDPETRQAHQLSLRSLDIPHFLNQQLEIGHSAIYHFLKV